MPYGLRKKGDQTCVYNTVTGDTVPGGCHPTHAQALRHQRAMMLNVPDAMGAAVSDLAMSPEEALQCAQNVVSNGMQLMGHHASMMDDEGAEGETASLTAAALMTPVKPPRAAFEMPEADKPTPLSVTADGSQVFGHLALFETCHRGFLNGNASQCVRAPRSPSNYSQFHLGQGIQTAEGDFLPVGRLTFDANHAPLHANLEDTRAHYDNSAKVGAYVRAHDGRFGIWLSGVPRPGLSEADMQVLRTNPPSGDWRSFNHALELVAALSVPVPGFPVQQSALSASANGEELSALILGGLTMEEAIEVTESIADDASYQWGKKKLSREKNDVLQAAAMSAKERNALPRSAFAIPSERAYPIHDIEHARNALARSSGKPEEGQVRRAVCRRYPALCRDNGN